MRADLLTVVESAYQLDGSARHWLQGLTDAVGPLIDGGFGVYGTLINASNPSQMQVGKVTLYRGDRVFVRAIHGLAGALSPTDVQRTYHSPSPISTATERVGVATWNAVARRHGPSNILDCIGVVAADRKGVGCMFAAPLARVHRYPERVRKVWARVVAHVLAIQRLRARLPAVGARAREEGEAVLSPDGTVEHALGAARGPSARARLRAAAQASERARGRLRRQSPEEAVELWQALVAGRWSIVDRFDRDGRRFLIAHENEPEGVKLRALSGRERQIITYVAMGHSNKLVAYELGLSVGAVGAYLSLALKKLGLTSRIELARFLRPPGSP